MPSQFVRIWRFHVRPERLAAFRAAYGPDGDWARLFRRAPGYRGTELLGCATDPATYLTIDRWETAAHWTAFRDQWGAEYAALDRACGDLTDAEHEVGSFEGPAPRHAEAPKASTDR